MRLPSEGFLAAHVPLRPVEGCPSIVAHQTGDLFALWEAWERESGGESAIPYWGSVWPAAKVLARHMLANQRFVADRTVLDLGCGGGVAGIAAARAGAYRVIANDIDPIALHIAKRNFTANNVAAEICTRNLVEEQDLLPVDLILVADLFYHRAAAASLLSFLRRARKSGATVIIADGQRPFAPETGTHLILQETVPVSPELEGVPNRDVRLMTLA
jgi:predicted nicotinamide N-methyase